MVVLSLILGAGLLFAVLLDAFETIVLPRRVTRRLRATRLFYRNTWKPYRALARRIRSRKRREELLGLYGPASLLLLLALWAVALVFAFGLLQFAAGSALEPHGDADFGRDLYFSGTTLFTLGLGDIHPMSAVARALCVVESGLGFGFLALVIGYFPVLYQSFSRREINVSLLDSRAGTPPSAGEVLQRFHGSMDMLVTQMLKEWELWSAELLESHLSYPVLAYFRSQHDNQSWLACLTTILDTSALLAVTLPDSGSRQPLMTFAIARHAVVDLANVFNTPPRVPQPDRLPPADFARMEPALARAGLLTGVEVEQRLAELRRIYEPYVQALSEYFLIALPPWLPTERRDNWLTTAWGRTAAPSAVSEPFAPD